MLRKSLIALAALVLAALAAHAACIPDPALNEPTCGYEARMNVAKRHGFSELSHNANRRLEYEVYKACMTRNYYCPETVSEVPRYDQTCAGTWNKAKGWMNEEGEICKFDPIDAQNILRICGEGPCLVVGSVVDCPVNCVNMTHITSIRRAPR